MAGVYICQDTLTANLRKKNTNLYQTINLRLTLRIPRVLVPTLVTKAGGGGGGGEPQVSHDFLDLRT